MTWRYDDIDYEARDQWANDYADEAPRRRKPSGCRGFASWDGPCGALDCPDCYPGSWDQPPDGEEPGGGEE